MSRTTPVGQPAPAPGGLRALALRIPVTRSPVMTPAAILTTGALALVRRPAPNVEMRARVYRGRRCWPQPAGIGLRRFAPPILPAAQRLPGMDRGSYARYVSTLEKGSHPRATQQAPGSMLGPEPAAWLSPWALRNRRMGRGLDAESHPFGQGATLNQPSGPRKPSTGSQRTSNSRSSSPLSWSSRLLRPRRQVTCHLTRRITDRKRGRSVSCKQACA